MAVREYVGARYVPKFMGTWSATTAYEALCIVDDGLGTSYTSKKPVPAGTALTDPEYWAVTGSTSGAIIALQDRVTALEQIFTTPQFYGAEANGVNDDSQAIKDALASGMNVYFPTGSYRVTEKLDIPSNIILFGSGTILDDYDADANGYTDNHVGVFNISNKENILIEGLKFEGPGAISGKWDHGAEIYIGSSTNVDIKDCEFFNIRKAYAVEYDASDTGKVDSCYIHEYTYSGIMFINSCKNLTAINNRVYDCKGKTPNHCYPISIGGYDYTITGVVPEAENNSVINNIIENTFPWWEGIDSHGGINMRIIGNTILNCYTGIAVVGETNGYYKPTNVTIADNIVIGPASTGDAEAYTNAGLNLTRSENVIVSGNEFSGWGQLSNNSFMSIRISKCKNVNFTGNQIHDCGTASASLLDVSGDQINIEGNNIRDNNAYYTFEMSGAVTNVSITGNSVFNSASNALVYGGNITNAADAPLNNTVDGNISDNVTCRQFSDTYKPQTCSMATGGGPVTSLHAGKVGDIIYNVAPAVGNPPGWICVTAQVDQATPAVYAKMAALS